jgi:hypothetical protein
MVVIFYDRFTSFFPNASKHCNAKSMPQFAFGAMLSSGWHSLGVTSAQHDNFAHARPFGQAQR